MKNTISSLLTVAFLMATSVSDTASAPRPTCGPAVNGHTIAGGQPTEWCPATDLPVFPEGSHTYSKQTTTCPIDQTPLIDGHTTVDGKPNTNPGGYGHPGCATVKSMLSSVGHASRS